jgi:hypothetical protein
MLFQDQPMTLIERIEILMRPLSERGLGPDHDRLRELYLASLEQSIGDPLEQARRAVLQEILSPYFQAIQEPATLTTQAAIDHGRRAIGLLATCICRLEEHNHDAATVSLEAAQQVLQDIHTYLTTAPPPLSSALMH